jgi:hypothetical protein
MVMKEPYNITNYNFIDDQTGGVAKALVYANPTEYNQPGLDSTEDFLRRSSIIFCKTAQFAEVAAKELAKAQPGAEVMILQTTSVVTAPPGVPVVSTVTEKGVLPK